MRSVTGAKPLQVQSAERMKKTSTMQHICTTSGPQIGKNISHFIFATVCPTKSDDETM